MKIIETEAKEFASLWTISSVRRLPTKTMVVLHLSPGVPRQKASIVARTIKAK
jgi:hypothetical protein